MYSRLLEELKQIEINLSSLQHFIRSTIDINPLDKIKQISNKLEDTLIQVVKLSDLNEQIEIRYKVHEMRAILAEYEKFLLNNIQEAETIAEELEKNHVASIVQWKNYFYNLSYVDDFRLLFSPYNDIFQTSLICYSSMWKKLSQILQTISNGFKKYQYNSLAQLLLQDVDFIRSLKGSQFCSGGIIGHCIIQRLLFMHSYAPHLANIILNNLIPGGIFHDMLEKDFFSYDQQVFKAEIIKLVLYKRLLLQQNIKPTAWIGSANTLTKLLDPPVHSNRLERIGIYLNCSAKYLTPEFNRAWLLALLKLGYEIKLVERQFPAIEKAILSQDPINFLLLLANEIRIIDKNNDPTISHSQYHGGDSPTATSLEILMLMGVGCTVTRDPNEGTISLCKAIYSCANFHTINAQSSDRHALTKPQYELKKSHSYTHMTLLSGIPYQTNNQLIINRPKYCIS